MPLISKSWKRIDRWVPFGSEQNVENGSCHYNQKSEGGKDNVGGEAVYAARGCGVALGIVLIFGEQRQEGLSENGRKRSNAHFAPFVSLIIIAK